MPEVFRRRRERRYQPNNVASRAIQATAAQAQHEPVLEAVVGQGGTGGDRSLPAVPIAHQLDAVNETATAHIADDLVTGLQRGQYRAHLAADLGGAVEQSFLLDDVEGCGRREGL